MILYFQSPCFFHVYLNLANIWLMVIKDVWIVRVFMFPAILAVFLPYITSYSHPPITHVSLSRIMHCSKILCLVELELSLICGPVQNQKLHISSHLFTAESGLWNQAESEPESLVGPWSTVHTSHHPLHTPPSPQVPHSRQHFLLWSALFFLNSVKYCSIILFYYI